MPITIHSDFPGFEHTDLAILRSPQSFLAHFNMMTTDDLQEAHIETLKTIVSTWTKDHADMVTQRVRLEQNLSRLVRAILPVWLSFKLIPGATLEKLVISMTDMLAKDLGIPEKYLPTTDDLIKACQKALMTPEQSK